MALSWIEAARVFGFKLRVCAPEGFQPPRGVGFELVADPAEAVRGADVVTTDVWISMGQEKEAAERRRAFAGHCVDEALLARARPEAIVLHCLPAHRGEEITAAVIDGPQSAVLDEAENRMHVQKALLEALILPDRPRTPA
jgi:ornithine carbamoyltransferase